MGFFFIFAGGEKEESTTEGGNKEKGVRSKLPELGKEYLPAVIGGGSGLRTDGALTIVQRTGEREKGQKTRRIPEQGWGETHWKKRTEGFRGLDVRVGKVTDTSAWSGMNENSEQQSRSLGGKKTSPERQSVAPPLSLYNKNLGERQTVSF